MTIFLAFGYPALSRHSPQEFALHPDFRASTNGPLAGLRVLDLSRVLAGPLCTMMLGDMGADVIKVERPGSGDETRQWGPPWVGEGDNRESAYYLSINRNKRSLAADLGSPNDREVVRSLALSADVLIENFAPGTLARWDLDYASLCRENPGLIYCTISGYGLDGPDSGRPGYDFAVQARSGWMAITGDPEGQPTKVGVAVVDVLTGQNAAIAILAAQAERSVSKRGQAIEVALLDSALAGLVNVGQAALAGAAIKRYGNSHATIVPYQAFATADTPVVVAVGNDPQWKRFCRAIGRDDLADHADYATNPSRVEHRAELVGQLAEIFLGRKSAEWLELLDGENVPCAPVQSVEDAVLDPAVRKRGGILEIRGDYGTVEAVASPLRFGRTPTAVREPPPRLGQHSREIREHGWLTSPGTSSA